MRETNDGLGLEIGSVCRSASAFTNLDLMSDSFIWVAGINADVQTSSVNGVIFKPR